jgi:hypothetical protein
MHNFGRHPRREIAMSYPSSIDLFSRNHRLRNPAVPLPDGESIGQLPMSVTMLPFRLKVAVHRPEQGDRDHVQPRRLNLACSQISRRDEKERRHVPF